MKNKVKIFITLFVLLLTFSTPFIACKAGKKENVIGTYKLVTDTRTAYQEETVNNIEKYGREAYLVLTDGDYGYYVYKDNYTSIFARKVKLEYTYNDEGKISLVSFQTEEGKTSKTFNVDSRDRVALISRWPSATKHIDAYDIQYNKVDKATDLSYIKKLYADLPVFDYGVYEYNGLYYAQLTNGLQKNFSEYIYKYYLFDTAQCKATLFYALKSDETPITVNNLPIVFTKNQETNKPIGVTINNVEYSLEYGFPSRQVKVNVNGEEVEVSEELYKNYSELSPDEYESYFTGLIEEYKNSLNATDN